MELPTNVGAYRVLSLVDEGGMGQVLRARHRSEVIAERQGGDVAVKVMHTQLASRPSFRERFEREAEERVMEQDAAVVIQRHWRGRCARVAAGCMLKV